MRISNHFDLAYCTNIHPAKGWNEVRQSLAQHSLEFKRRLSPDRPFAIGLRLSNSECIELLEGSRLQEFAAFLKDSGLYVALLNGYVYGEFHGAPVKANVFAPDWTDEERILYTLRLAQILKTLLPEGMCGGISTAPISYKPWIRDELVFRKAVHSLVRVASELIRIERESGKHIRLEVEPEPDGLIENSGEVIGFFKEWLFREGAEALSSRCGVSREEACALLARHICVCFDTCHSAIEYEDPESVLNEYKRAGIEVGRIQLSSALAVALPAPDIVRQLQPFDDSTYLHQVIERRPDGSLRRFRDLGDALMSVEDPIPREWRIHFHVPLFTSGHGDLGSTQGDVSRVIRSLRKRNYTGHLEIETYTWSVLPDFLKVSLADSIVREYRWVLAALEGDAEER